MLVDGLSISRMVEHDAHHTAQALRGEVVLEVRPHHARVAVWPCDLAPDDTDLGATDPLLAPVHVCDPLAEVEVGGLGVIDALDLDEGGAWAEGVLATLEGNVLALDIPC